MCVIEFELPHFSDESITYSWKTYQISSSLNCSPTELKSARQDDTAANAKLASVACVHLSSNNVSTEHDIVIEMVHANKCVSSKLSDYRIFVNHLNLFF